MNMQEQEEEEDHIGLEQQGEKSMMDKIQEDFPRTPSPMLSEVAPGPRKSRQSSPANEEAYEATNDLNQHLRHNLTS